MGGYSASGKSTLLQKSLRSGIPLFGHDVNDEFQKTAIPPRLPEHSLSFSETLQCGTWFSGFHLQKLQDQACLPSTVVIHVDITELLWNTQRIPLLTEQSAKLFPRSLESLIKLEDNERIITDYFSAPFFKRFERVVINTLVCPWERIVSNYQIRRSTNTEVSRSRDLLFVNGGPGPRMFNAANTAWLKVARQTTAKCLITISGDKTIHIKEVSKAKMA